MSVCPDRVDVRSAAAQRSVYPRHPVRAFSCHTCGQLVVFDSTTCLTCGSELGFWWPDRGLLTLATTPESEALSAVGEAGGAPAALWRCANRAIAGCNWVVETRGELCFSCALTRTRPDDDHAKGLREFRVAEGAKRWLLFELGELGLPVESPRERDGGLAFDLLSSDAEPVTTGHSHGVITLDLAESDDARRVARREQLGEPYRTVLGHLRHEIGHYYWPILVAGDEPLARWRELFGDECEDYDTALERHYRDGPPQDWRERFVSAYATMHPSEDWAETFAHYLHIRDGVQTASAYRVQVHGPASAPPPRLASELDSSARPSGHEFDRLLAAWLPLTYALNAINRSIGRSDLYPFVLPPPVVAKLAFVHELVDARA